MTEKQIQDQIRDVLAFYHDIFITRTNVGSGWIGAYEKDSNGGVFIPKPRWFSTGLPKGFPDLCGYRSLIISPAMVGQKFAQFAFIEVKTPTGRVRPEQLVFLRKFLHDGAIGGICRSPEEALFLFKGGV